VPGVTALGEIRIDAVILDRAPQLLDEHVADLSFDAVSRDSNSGVERHDNKRVRSELRPLIGTENYGRTVESRGFFESDTAETGSLVVGQASAQDLTGVSACDHR